MRRVMILLALFTVSACHSRKGYVADANALMKYCAQSRLAKWDVRARAAGADCAVLLIETNLIMEETMVDAMHHGTGAYDLYDGGVDRYARERSFRGVVYKDSSGRVWTYGTAKDFQPCQ